MDPNATQAMTGWDAPVRRVDTGEAVGWCERIMPADTAPVREPAHGADPCAREFAMSGTGTDTDSGRVVR